MTNRTEEIKAKSEIAKREGFEVWKSQSLVRAMISTIPPMENPDMLQALLQSAFETGFAAGNAAVILDMLDHMKRMPPKEY